MKYRISSALLAIIVSCQPAQAWPDQHVKAKQALAKMRESVELKPTTPPGDAKLALDSDEIVFEITRLYVYTDIAVRFFADKKDQRLFVGTLRGVEREAFINGMLDIPSHAVESGRWTYFRKFENGKSFAMDRGKPPSSDRPRQIYVPEAVFEFTPTLPRDGTINLDVKLGVLEVIWPAKGAPDSKPKFEVSERAQNTQIKPGDTIVIGGGLQKHTGGDYWQIPVVSNLPYVGSCFKYARYFDREVEVLFVITPR